MDESFESKVEEELSSEELISQLEVLLMEIQNEATKLGHQAVSGKDFGFAEDVEEKKSKAREMLERVMKVLEKEGEKTGIAAMQRDLPLE